MKAIVVTDFAYKGLKRSGRGTGRQGLKATLQYLQYRDTRNNRLARSRSYERWQDRGLGVHHREIFARCEQLKSPHVLAWTWVISPAPDLMELVAPSQRRDLLSELTERVVEDYYTERGFDMPEYAYVLHRASTKPQDGEPPREHLHAHVVLPGTAPSAADRIPVYNNVTKGHDRLFREVATGHFAALLDERNIDWRSLRPELDNDRPLTFDELFPR
jgi:hypothetical protein